MSSTDVLITEVTRLDADDVLALFKTEKSIWSSGGGQAWYRYWQQRGPREYWVKAVEPPYCTLLGFVHWTIRRDGWRTLADIIVSPTARGRGVGKRLVEHLGDPIRLKTDVGAPSNEFYQRLGFRCVETKPSKNGKKQLNVYERGGPAETQDRLL